MKSDNSTRPTTSTPTSFTIFAARGFTSKLSNSSWEMCCLLPEPVSNKDRRVSLTNTATSCSLSTTATTLITSTRIPTSMLRPVNAVTRMKISINTPKTQLSSESKYTKSDWSGRVPRRNRESIASGTDLKCLSPISVPRVAVLKPIAHTYTMQHNKQNVTSTDLVAATMPEIMIMSSGTDCNTLTIRPALAKRSKRDMRTTEAPDVSFSEVSAAAFTFARRTKLKTQVSNTYKIARSALNKNDISFKHCRLHLKAKKQMRHSKQKVRQKPFSRTMNTGCALQRTGSLFKSMSTEIQTALKATTPNITVSNHADLATH
mmetsp:Transcript_7948/g.21918  ORF Transcript_7948/g.21918 Transcript_7948/m.21918 type:complete len:318 (-) Transcript_7948:164-1117(-)